MCLVAKVSKVSSLFILMFSFLEWNGRFFHSHMLKYSRGVRDIFEIKVMESSNALRGRNDGCCTKLALPCVCLSISREGIIKPVTYTLSLWARSKAEQMNMINVRPCVDRRTPWRDKPSILWIQLILNLWIHWKFLYFCVSHIVWLLLNSPSTSYSENYDRVVAVAPNCGGR